MDPASDMWVQPDMSLNQNMTTYAADFESYYDTECSIRTLGPQAYFNHPLFEAYLITVVGDDGFTFVGHPKDFDWELLRGNTVVAHNASFDYALYRFGVEQGWYPDVPFDCHCTADMVAYFGIPRSLKESSKHQFGIEVSKTVRDDMKGKQWGNMTPEFQEDVRKYALVDSELCLRLWQELGGDWPEAERQISAANRQIGMNGIPIDQELLKKNLETIKARLFEAEQSIPWIGEKTALSRAAINAECRKHSIKPPSSWAADSEEAEEWFKKHGAEHLWAKAVRDYRRINAFMRKLEAFDRGTMSDGRYYGGFMYFGANPTGRFSGSGGNLNLQNLPRAEMFGVSFRQMIKASPGHKLVTADLSQIEVRTLCHLAKDEKALTLIRESADVYEAFGVLLGLYNPEDGPLRGNPALRQKVKTICLGCGYGMGPDRFASDNDMELNDATEAVGLYRRQMKSVVAYWKELQQGLALSHSLEVPYTITIASGRVFDYGRIKRMRDPRRRDSFQYIAKISRFGKKRDIGFYGGKLAENISQGLARDVFADMMSRVADQNLKIIMHVHDEIVCEVPEDSAEEALDTVLGIMSIPPDWISDLPVAAEGTITDFYTK